MFLGVEIYQVFGSRRFVILAVRGVVLCLVLGILELEECHCVERWEVYISERSMLDHEISLAI